MLLWIQQITSIPESISLDTDVAMVMTKHYNKLIISIPETLEDVHEILEPGVTIQFIVINE